MGSVGFVIEPGRAWEVMSTNKDLVLKCTKLNFWNWSFLSGFAVVLDIFKGENGSMELYASNNSTKSF